MFSIPQDHDAPLVQHLSFGTVEDQSPVEFDPERGYIVNVALQPARVTVRCRVLQRTSGKGEGEHPHPFVPGDEVLVAIPISTRGPCVILGKLSNKEDAFPTTVGGQDATKNAFAMLRRAVPYIEETKGSWTTFSQPSGAFVSMSAEGTITFRDGSTGSLQLSADAFGYLSGDGKHALQIDLSGKRAVLRVDAAMMVLASGGPSAIHTPRTLALECTGNPAHEHAISTEAVAGILLQLLLAVGGAFPGPITGPGLVAAAVTALPAALAAAAVTPLLPTVAVAIQAGFASALQKSPGVPGMGQLHPGIGSPGLLIG